MILEDRGDMYPGITQGWKVYGSVALDVARDVMADIPQSLSEAMRY